jgi:hypothetical protein
MEKSSGNISGVLELMETFSLEKIEKIFKFWVEVTLPMEEREKRVRKEADKAANQAFEKLVDAKIIEENDQLSNFLEIYKRKS